MGSQIRTVRGQKSFEFLPVVGGPPSVNFLETRNDGGTAWFRPRCVPSGLFWGVVVRVGRSVHQYSVDLFFGQFSLEFVVGGIYGMDIESFGLCLVLLHVVIIFVDWSKPKEHGV